jgi:hypothetical protein
VTKHDASKDLVPKLSLVEELVSNNDAGGDQVPLDEDHSDNLRDGELGADHVAERPVHAVQLQGEANVKGDSEASLLLEFLGFFFGGVGFIKRKEHIQEGNSTINYEDDDPWVLKVGHRSEIDEVD